MAHQSKCHRKRHRQLYTYGDSDVISMPADFRRHLVGKTLRNVFHGCIAKIRSVVKLVITETLS